MSIFEQRLSPKSGMYAQNKRLNESFWTIQIVGTNTASEYIRSGKQNRIPNECTQGNDLV